MPTTLLHNESLEQAKHRRFQEEAAEHARSNSTKTEMSIVDYEDVVLWVRLKTSNGERYVYSVETEDSLVNILPLLTEATVERIRELAEAVLDADKRSLDQDTNEISDPAGVAYCAHVDEQIDRMRERS